MDLPLIAVKALPPSSAKDQRLAEQRHAIVELLGEILGETTSIQHRDNGAPFLPDFPHLHLSLSHTTTAVALALSELSAPIGIDIEAKSNQAARLLMRYSLPNERVQLSSSGTDPVILWCAKEAIYKRYGGEIREGLVKGIQLIDIEGDQLTFTVNSDKGGSHVCYAFILSPSDPTLVIATETKLPQPVPSTYIHH